MTDETRPDPEALLRRLSAEREGGGRLKIFFGYAAGVGKTYAMLEAAQRARAAGVDVVAGYIEPHSRPETLALLEGLESLAPLSVPYKNILLREFDLDAALRRRPALLLVDELAHTNAPACRHRKRYQDIEELLRAGIDVYTTVNVQHLESLNDVVSSLTGVTVSERVPDRVFDTADEVELIDVEPAELIERLQAGKIYRTRQAERALAHFFSRENLVALREIALRRTADRLSRAERAGGAAPRAGEHILTCLSGAPSNVKVIRTAARMAEAFHSEFTALYVESAPPEGEAARRLRANLRLAEQLGARIATVYGEDTALQIAEYARAAGVSKIVLGRSNYKRGLLSPRRALVDRLTQLAPSLDIYIIPDRRPPVRRRLLRPLHLERLSPLDLGKTLLLAAAATGVGWLFRRLGLSEANIITVYLLGVLCTSIVTQGRLYGVLSSLLGVTLFNFCFTEPRFSLAFYDAGYPLTFLVMLLSGLLTSSLTMRMRQQARDSARKAFRTEVLFETNRRLQTAAGEAEILSAAAGQLCKLLDRPILLYPTDADGALLPPTIYPAGRDALLARYATGEERAVAAWVHRNNKRAGAATGTLPSAKCTYLAVRGRHHALAVAAVPADDYPEPEAFEKNLLLSILDECGLALEKARLHREKVQAEMAARQEALRANLLRAISHDLRTPLTSISGNAGILMENSASLDERKKRMLYADIYDDAMWLYNLVENLLSVTRIENGTMQLRLSPELIDEIFREALCHLDRRAAEYQITTRLSDDLLMAEMDAQLIIQVIINIVGNAIKYTPSGSHIELRAARQGALVVIEIADDGPGIPDDAKAHLFDMFFTVSGERGDSRRGLGLGLSLCKSIVTAHGGTIEVRDNLPRGSLFRFTLRGVEVNSYE